jgi:two-component system response regulator YesN
MSQRWLKRQVLSYLPLLFLIIFILLAFMLFSLAQESKKDVVSANGVFAKHVEQVVDYNLRSVEQLLLNAAIHNDKIKNFFNLDIVDEAYFRNYEISNELDKLKVSNPLIDSIYLYRSKDNTIMSENMLTLLDQHTDQAFIKEQLKDQSVRRKWSNARIYQDNAYSVNMNRVVSIASKFPPPSGNRGMIVINVKVQEIERLVKEMSSTSDISYAQLLGTDRNYIFDPQINSSAKVLHKFSSSYTGWEIHAGIKDGKLFLLSSRLLYMIFSIGFALLIMGTCWIIYAARNHYKPIQTILGQIINYSSKQSNIFQEHSAKSRDELKFIEEAIENLCEQVSEYEKEQKEGLTFKRRHMMNDLMSGSLILNLDEWKKEMSKLKRASEFENMSTAIIEVDHYSEFEQNYSNRDQYLFKFVINSVLKEIAEQHHVNVWAEWLESQRLSILFLSQQDHKLTEEILSVICNGMVEWVKANLEFSITIGVSGCISDTEQIYLIHSQAGMALNYKSVKGNNQVIHHIDLSSEDQGEVYKLIPYIRSLAYYFRIGQSRWQDEFNLLFQELTSGMYTKSDVYYLINSLIYNLYREMIELPEEFHALWKSETIPRMNTILNGIETVEETKVQMIAVLLETEEKFLEYREKRKHHSLIQDVRKYIEEHYSNPDLSLKHLEDEFGLSGKYLSFLFHDEIGIKFVDYLSRIRLEHAKKLLIETALTVQDIATLIGYMNSMTFIRGFKKHFGVTPGDYRKKS